MFNYFQNLLPLPAHYFLRIPGVVLKILSVPATEIKDLSVSADASCLWAREESSGPR